jgi:cation transport regulator ChaB
MRNRFQLDDEIGFGSLPQAHSVYSLGMLVGVYQATNGVIVYSDSRGLFREYVVLPENERERVIISPDFRNKKPHILSIYQKKGWWDNGNDFESKVLTVSNQVLSGVAAHEFSEYLKEYGTLPQEIRDVLRKKEDDFKNLCNEASAYARKSGKKDDWSKFMDKHHVSTNGEDDIDVIAGLFGFREEVLAKIDYVIECLKNYMGPRKDFQKITPSEAIAQLKFRREQVIKYC